ITCLGLLPLLVAGLSYADISANLKVSGDIKPPTCSINNQNEVDIEYRFDIAPEMFPSSDILYLDGETKRIEIVCDAATYLNFIAKDNRSDSVINPGDILFGLGKYGADNSQNIGVYTITMSNATVKENSEEADKNVLILSGNTAKLKTDVNQLKKIAWAETSTKLAAGKIFAADFEVYAVLDIIRTNNIEDISLDGSATLSFGFG
ncbi:fimbrial protein, partial [Providencia stuartii]|uniref:fimbrial protein n=1 Tax=Providencia stuartii TaxID=588 RepID=UPI001EF83AA5